MQEADNSSGDTDPTNQSAGDGAISQKDSNRPQANQIPSDYKQSAKKFLNKFIWSPIAKTVVWLDGHNGLVTGLATVAMAVLTFYLAYYANEQGRITDKQLLIMKAQLKEMKSSGNQAERLITANESLAKTNSTMADLTRRSVVIAEQASGRGQRARISIPSAQITTLAGVFITASVQIQNSGGGTAKGKMRAVATIAHYASSPPAIPKNTPEASLTVNPIYGTTLPVRFPISEQQRSAVIAGDNAIIVYGDYQFVDESKAVTLCVFRLHYRGSGSDERSDGPALLEQTRKGNDCTEQKAPPVEPPVQAPQ